MANWRQAADAVVQVLANTPPGSATVVSAIQAVDPLASAKTYVGWPDPSTLLLDLRQATTQIAHVSVYAIAGSVLSSRYNREPVTLLTDATIHAVTSVNTITLSASVLTPGDNVIVFVNGFMVGATVGVGDSLAAIAGRLATAITALGLLGVTASAVASVLTVTGPRLFSLSANSFGQGRRLVEVTRLTRRFQVSTWCNDNLAREAVATSIISALADIEFLTYADNSKGRILFAGEVIDDMSMPAQVMRSDTFWEVEYPYFTTSTLARLGCINESLAIVTPQQAVLNVVPSALTLTTSQATLVPRITHDHITEFPAPQISLPTATFLLSSVPVPASELLFLNGAKLRRVSTTPGVGEYTISQQTIILWRQLDSTDDLEATYEI